MRKCIAADNQDARGSTPLPVLSDICPEYGVHGERKDEQDKDAANKKAAGDDIITAEEQNGQQDDAGCEYG